MQRFMADAKHDIQKRLLLIADCVVRFGGQRFAHGIFLMRVRGLHS
jgi:hypothetical protein